MKTKEKRTLLVRLIELYVYNGYDISDFVGKPFSYFNYDHIKKIIAEMDSDNE